MASRKMQQCCQGKICEKISIFFNAGLRRVFCVLNRVASTISGKNFLIVFDIFSEMLLISPPPPPSPSFKSNRFGCWKFYSGNYVSLLLQSKSLILLLHSNLFSANFKYSSIIFYSLPPQFFYNSYNLQFLFYHFIKQIWDFGEP